MTVNARVNVLEEKSKEKYLMKNEKCTGDLDVVHYACMKESNAIPGWNDRSFLCQCLGRCRASDLGESLRWLRKMPNLWFI